MSNNQILKKSLSSRHLIMISLGGSIGTGIFVGLGLAINIAGPGGSLLAYTIIGLMVYFLMTSLGEMATHFPNIGSFGEYGSRFFDPAFGFAQGWNYWFNWAITLAVELVAAALIMQFWFPDVPSWIWSAIFFIIIISINMFSTRVFGETEFWLSLIKVVTIVVFIIIGIAMIFGILSSDETAGVNNFQELKKNWLGDDAPFSGGLLAVIGVTMIAAFSFQGTELVGVGAGEAKDPQHNVPRAIRSIFWRILLFYVLTIIVIASLINYQDPRLLSSDIGKDISTSPFVLVFEKAGVAFIASIMNAIILTSILSAGNSGLYASSRILYSLAKNKMAPQVFTKLNSKGVPIYAVIITAAIAGLSFLTSICGTGAIYQILLNISGLSGLITWLGISITHYRFRKGYILQGRKIAELKYKAPFYPYGPIIAFIICVLVILGQDFNSLLKGELVLVNIINIYLGVAIFLIIWFGYKLIYKTKVIAYKDIQFD